MSRAKPARRRGLALPFAGQEDLGQRQDVLPPLAQRRHGERHDAQAVEEVVPEGAGGHRLAEVDARGSDEAHVDLDRARAPEPLEAAVLHHAQELGLQGRGEVLDLVEDDGAARRELDLPRLGLLGVREGARLVAEQLRFQEVGGDGRAVDLDEREVTARATLVEEVGDEVLARPALSLDEHGGLRLRQAERELQHVAHGGGDGHHAERRRGRGGRGGRRHWVTSRRAAPPQSRSRS